MQPYALDFAEDVEINGSRQNIRIRSRSLALPALLFLHGGPGVTDRHLVLKSCEQLTKSCTLVCWDQRGCGKSFTPKKVPYYKGIGGIVKLLEQIAQEKRKSESKKLPPY